MGSLAGGLLWKEWRQLRLLRIGGAALILFAPVLLLACAEAARRGWIPLIGEIANYSVSTVIQNALPLLLSLAVWPLLALMLAAQCFCADRASGTEWFWKERPVSPRRVWLARLTASSGSLCLILGVHLAVWWGMVLVWGDRRAFDTVDAETRWLLMGDLSLNSVALVVLLGLFAALAAFAAGAAAAAFVRSPMQALLLGIVLTVVPFGLGAMLSASYPGARLGETSLGAIFSCLLLPAYLASSYLADCRGEPAGRGRWVRASSVILATTLAVVVLTPPVSAWVSYQVAIRLLGGAELDPSPDGRRLLVRNWGEGSAWLLDATAAEELVRFPPHILWAAWNSDGTRLAMIRADRGGVALDVLDQDGAALAQGLDCGRCDDVAWVGEFIAFRTYDDGRWGLRLTDPSTGDVRAVTGIPEGARPFLLGPTSSGAFFVLGDESRVGRVDGGRTASLSEFDPDAAAIGEPVVERSDPFFPGFSSISPCGRFFVLGGKGGWRIVDLDGGPDLEPGGRPVWLPSGEPVWTKRIEGRGVVVSAGAGPSRRELRRFPTAHHGILSVSPDGARLLLAVLTKRESKADDAWDSEHWIYEPARDAWTELRVEPSVDAIDRPTRVEWVGRETLALMGAGMLALKSLDDSDEPRFIIGG